MDGKRNAEVNFEVDKLYAHLEGSVGDRGVQLLPVGGAFSEYTVVAVQNT